MIIKAEENVSKYFQDQNFFPTEGSIGISDERFILSRCSSMSVEFYDIVASLYKDQGKEEARAVTYSILFDMAHSIGKADAKRERITTHGFGNCF